MYDSDIRTLQIKDNGPLFLRPLIFNYMSVLLVGLLTLFQPQFAFPDSVSNITKLHDSLMVQNGEVLFLTDLEGWEFTSDNIEDSLANVRWVRLEQPISNEDSFPDSLWNGFGYFRLKFKVDSTYSQKEAILRFSSFRNVSTDIYLNDKSILKIGNPSREKDSEDIVARYTGIGQPVNLNPDTEYTLVVKKSYQRYSLYSTLIFINTSKPHLFSFSLASPEYVQAIIERQKVNILIAGISVSVIFILSVLYLILYFKVKDQQENLWLVLLMVSIGGIALNWFLGQFTVHSFWFSLLLDFFVMNLLAALSFVLIPLVTHKLLKVQAHIFWKVYVIAGTVLYFFRIEFLGDLTFLFIILISLTGGLIAIYKASKQGVKDTFIPALSILGVPSVVFVALSIDYLGYDTVYFLPVLTLLVYNILPVGLSIYQGKKFLRLNTEMEDLVAERTIQLESANDKLEESLRDLKATQSQLVQQEKLASLGQLTAGIAHEIKNPLNFVNNFSNVSIELMNEALEELGKTNQDDHTAETAAILSDIKTNLTKIHEHGSRADGIVKSMLQHSRGGSGQKKPTDLNASITEYSNLAFHGMRAGKHPIEVDIEYELDESVGMVPLIAEDFSRVILNLCNNAFDALRQKTENRKQKTENGAQKTDSNKRRAASGEPFEARITIRTKRNGDTISLEIEDNGPGISDEIKDKILQPFFTTKKGTEGTGLGLSITHDIVKAHGGYMDLYTQPGQTIFTVTLKD